jgi:hypothetical protein
MIDVRNYIPIVDKLQTKYIILAIILLFILIVVIIDVFSYINILSKSSENPEVPKSRATARLIADIVLTLILIFFVGYYGYKYFNPNPFVVKGKNKYVTGKFPPLFEKGSFTGCADADSMSLAEKLMKTKINNNIDLRPNDCGSNGCKNLEDPSNPKTKCDDKSNGYSYRGIIKSFPNF